MASLPITLNPRRLRIDVKVRHGVDARALARLVTAVDRAFNLYARDRYGIRGARVQIVETGTSSWWAIFTGVQGMTDLAIKYPDIFPIFVHELGKVYAHLNDHGPSDTATFARALLRDVAREARRIGASAVEFASDIRLVIVASYYDQLEHADTDTSPKAQLFNDDRIGHLVAIAPSIERAAKLARTSQLFGAIFRVDGSWYVRAEGMHGVLVPLSIEGGTMTGSRDGAVVQIRGDIMRSAEGHPIAIHVHEMKIIN